MKKQRSAKEAATTACDEHQSGADLSFWIGCGFLVSDSRQVWERRRGIEQEVQKPQPS